MIEEKFLSQLPFVAVVDPKIQPAFCVDGRTGKRKTEGPYPQALGGSFHFVILNWLINGGDFNQVFEETFNNLKNLGYQLGLHRDTHAYGESAGCGFADNIRKIIKIHKEKSSEIWEILNSLTDLSSHKDIGDEILNLVRKKDITQIPSGDKIIEKGENLGAEIQVLDGDHQELAAIVNLVEGTTLDVDNNQEHQAFNLDLWYVLRAARDLGIEEERAKLLSLGLYLATEIVLVEGKGKSRLPILLKNG